MVHSVLGETKMKTIWARRLFCILSLVFTIGAYAESSASDGNLWRPNDVWTLCSRNSLALNVWGAARHSGGKKYEKLDEQLTGFGLRWNCSENVFLEYDRLSKNSINGEASVIGAGLQGTLFSIGPAGFGGGILYAKTTYEIPPLDITLSKPRTIPFLKLSYNKWFAPNQITGPPKKTKTFRLTIAPPR